MQGIFLAFLLARLTLSGGAWASYDYFQSSRDTLRPPHALRLGLTGGIAFYGLSFNLNILFNSDDRFSPQASSAYGVHPAWSWGRLYVGDFSPSFSSYVLHGTQVRGGGIELFPRPLRLFLVRGRVRSVEAETLGVRRRISGLLLSLGPGRNLTLELLQVRDEGEPQSPLQGSWTAGLGLKLRYRWLTLEGKGAASLNTRDLNASPLPADSLPLPTVLAQTLTINTSSHADFAFQVKGALRGGPGFIQTQYEYIGPGYTSLGLQNFQNDRQSLQVITGFGLLQGKVYLSGTYLDRKDNVVRTKDGTTHTTNGSLTLALAPARGARLTTGVVLLAMDKQGRSDTTSLSSAATSFLLSGAFRLGRASLNLTYSFNRVRTEAFLNRREQGRHTGGVSLNLPNLLGPAGLRLGLNNLIRQDSLGLNLNTRGNLTLLVSPEKAPWQLSAGIAYTGGKGRHVLDFEAGGQWKFGRIGTLNLRAYHRRAPAGPETRVTLTHRIAFR